MSSLGQQHAPLPHRLGAMNAPSMMASSGSSAGAYPSPYDPVTSGSHSRGSMPYPGPAPAGYPVGSAAGVPPPLLMGAAGSGYPVSQSASAAAAAAGSPLNSYASSPSGVMANANFEAVAANLYAALATPQSLAGAGSDHNWDHVHGMHAHAQPHAIPQPGQMHPHAASPAGPNAAQAALISALAQFGFQNAPPQ